MSIAAIIPAMLLPERELIIGKSFALKGNAALLASVTEHNGIIKLWLFQQMPAVTPSGADGEAAVPLR